MQRITVLAVAILAVTAMAGLATSFQLAPGEPEKGLTGLLKPGMQVSAQVKGDVYTITVNPMRTVREPAVTVVEVGDFYVVLEDRSRVEKRYIPVWAIREVVVRRTGVSSDPPREPAQPFEPPRPVEPPRPSEPARASEPARPSVP
jgi:hypothetical protein